MEYITLSKIENQSFFVMIDGIEVDFRLHYFRGILYCDVSIDGEVVAYSVRCTNNAWLIPDIHVERVGNFRFETSDNSYPNAQNFGDTCTFVHYGKEEFYEMRA